MWVHLFSGSLMGVKAEPPNQLLPKHRLALPWRRAFATPHPAAQGWGAQPAQGGLAGRQRLCGWFQLVCWFSCAWVLGLTPSHRHVLPDSVTRLLFLEAAF